MRKFKRPINDNYRYYCYHCAYWTFVKDVGCAHIGVCNGVEGEPTEQDAYDGMCGLFKKHDNQRTVTKAD